MDIQISDPGTHIPESWIQSYHVHYWSVATHAETRPSILHLSIMFLVSSWADAGTGLHPRRYPWVYFGVDKAIWLDGGPWRAVKVH